MVLTSLWTTVFLNVLILYRTGVGGTSVFVGDSANSTKHFESLSITANSFDNLNNTVHAVNGVEHPKNVTSILFLNFTHSALTVEVNDSFGKTDDYTHLGIEGLDINVTSTDDISRQVPNDWVDSESGIRQQLIERKLLFNSNHSDEEFRLRDTNTSANALVSILLRGKTNDDFNNKEGLKNGTQDLRSRFRPEIIDKDSSFLNCSKEELRETEYVVFENGTLYATKYRLTLNSSFYSLSGKTAIVCKNFVDETGILDRFSKAVHVALKCFIVSLGSLLSAWLYICSYTPFMSVVAALASTLIAFFVIVLKLSLVSGSTDIFYFNILALLTTAWIVLLSCEGVLQFLVERGYLKVSRGQYKVKLATFCYLNCVTAFAITAVTFQTNFIFNLEKAGSYEVDGTLYQSPLLPLSPAICSALTFVFLTDFGVRPYRMELDDLGFCHTSHFDAFFNLLIILCACFISGIVLTALGLYKLLLSHAITTVFLTAGYLAYLGKVQLPQLQRQPISPATIEISI